MLATDPDADRLGVYAKDTKTGEYMSFTGNMSGLLIAEYELSRKKEMGLLPEPRENGALVTTIVSSNMAFSVAKEYGLTAIEVLTGFKYIGEQIKNFEQAKAENGGKYDAKKGAYEYLFGYEESYGCLVGTHARDKDAVMGSDAGDLQKIRIFQRIAGNHLVARQRGGRKDQRHHERSSRLPARKRRRRKSACRTRLPCRRKTGYGNG